MGAATRTKLSLVVPLYNEEDALPTLVREIEAFRSTRDYITEVVLVDDGSSDQSAAVIRRLTMGLPGYVVIHFSRNFGHQLAITAGLELVTTDAAVVLDADLQDPLDVIDQMVVHWREGYDDVYGIRRSRQGEGAVKRGLAHAFYVFFRRFTGLDAPVDVGDFRLMSRKVIDAYKHIQEQQPYVRGLISWLGFNQIGVEYDRPPRTAGGTKYTFRKMAHLASSGLTSFSNRPLRYAIRAGVLISGLSFLGLIWAVTTKLLYPDTISGWASLIFVGFFFGGVQLLFLGVVGAYVGRVYDEVKRRPRFVVRDVWTSGEPPPGSSVEQD